MDEIQNSAKVEVHIFLRIGALLNMVFCMLQCKVPIADYESIVL